jgi:hypothetical protein
MWSSGLWEGMVIFFFVCIALAMSAGAALMWVAPKIWAWVKPIVHAWTS